MQHCYIRVVWLVHLSFGFLNVADFKAISRGTAGAGDTVKLVILGPEPEPTAPADLRVALTDSHEAKTLWKDLTPSVVAIGSAGSIRPRDLRPGPAGLHGPSNSSPRESGALVV
jgi:hypothetical protein